MSGEPSIRLREAAPLIGMSPSYPRKSTCPRHRMRGNGPMGRPILVYYASEVLAWWASRETRY